MTINNFCFIIFLGLDFRVDVTEEYVWLAYSLLNNLIQI